ncbi:MAG: methyltransferase RsmF C-terminal domain-like protein, partial [Anaerolineae bacterium]
WHVGEMRGGRFVPSHALALGLTLADARRALSLSVHDAEVLRYLRGEILTAAGEPGWVLVGVDGFPLGWGFRVGDTVKNHYLRHLRQNP